MADADWDQLHTFLKAAQTGSFTQAAKELGVSQPTVSRRMEDLEQLIEAPLFVRHSRGLRLTERGEAMLESVRGLDSRVQEIFRRARGDLDAPSGVVRLTVNEPLAVYALPHCFAQLRNDYPSIQLEVVVDNRSADLTLREADIAVRMYKPTQNDLIARHIGDLELGFFASESYLARAPSGSPLDTPGHTLIGLDADPSWPKMLAELGLRHDQFAFRCDNLLMGIAAGVAGVGIFGTHVHIGRSLGLTQLPAPVTVPALPVWVVRHESLRHNRAIAVVTEAISRALLAYCGDQMHGWPSATHAAQRTRSIQRRDRPPPSQPRAERTSAPTRRSQGSSCPPPPSKQPSPKAGHKKTGHKKTRYSKARG